jgi:predicted O-methyltransferase YrrM
MKYIINLETRKMDTRFGKSKILEIQNKKRAWDNDFRPLNDGSLPAAGILDHPSDTFSSVVKSSQEWEQQQIMYNLCLIHRPDFVLELGMNLGISTSYYAAALKSLGMKGIIHTIDASPYKIKHAKEMHLKLGLDNIKYTTGLFYDILSKILDTSPIIDMAFIDGQHEYEPTIKFFHEISGKSRSGTVLIFDDISGYSMEMDQAWLEIKNHDSIHSWAEFKNLGWVVLS